MNNHLDNANLIALQEQDQTDIIALKKQVNDLQKQLDLVKKEKYNTPQYKYIYEEKLNPPAYQPTIEEIKLATARYAFNNNIWQIFHYLRLYISSLEGKELHFPYTKDTVQKEATDALNLWDKALEKWDDNHDIWDCFVDKDWFNTVYVNGLSDYHSGNCTAFACSCSRCEAEHIFQLDNTATWGKEEGSKMELAYIKHMQEKKDSII